jgi:hypothetical protein
LHFPHAESVIAFPHAESVIVLCYVRVVLVHMSKTLSEMSKKGAGEPGTPSKAQKNKKLASPPRKRGQARGKAEKEWSNEILDFLTDQFDHKTGRVYMEEVIVMWTKNEDGKGYTFWAFDGKELKEVLARDIMKMTKEGKEDIETESKVAKKWGWFGGKDAGKENPMKSTAHAMDCLGEDSKVEEVFLRTFGDDDLKKTALIVETKGGSCFAWDMHGVQRVGKKDTQNYYMEILVMRNIKNQDGWPDLKGYRDFINKEVLNAKMCSPKSLVAARMKSGFGEEMPKEVECLVCA